VTAVRAATAGSLRGWASTFVVAVVAKGDGGEEDEAVFWKQSLLDLVVSE
jgi:hypothetical protein